jgi:hypothetical protein
MASGVFVFLLANGPDQGPDSNMGPVLECEQPLLPVPHSNRPSVEPALIEARINNGGAFLGLNEARTIIAEPIGDGLCYAHLAHIGPK